MLGLPALLVWAIVLALPWRPWSTRERLNAEPAAPADTDLSDIVVLIPARDEADVLATSLAALAAQGTDLKVVVVDDQSSDRTAEVISATRDRELTLVVGKPLPPGWTGKLWALEQGSTHIDRPLVLLLDADIALAPGTLAALRRKLRDQELGLVSLMAELSMVNPWEKLLIPAFIYFFKLIYPFRLSNSSLPWVAAAAGGCVLIEARALRAIGGFRSYHDALIDDCALARRVKNHGFGTWIGLTRSARSLRGYTRLGEIWVMVARAAFTQLRYSPLWLALCTLLMAVSFVAPVVALVMAPVTGKALGAAALLAMMMSYLPTLRFYERSPAWALALPVVGVLYLAMTWDSAFRYWRGATARWKDRIYRPERLTGS